MHDGWDEPATSVSLFEATQVQLVARLFARVLLKWSEGRRGAFSTSPHCQRLLLEARGCSVALSWQARWQRGLVAGRGVRFGRGVAEVEQPLSVLRSQ